MKILTRRKGKMTRSGEWRIDKHENNFSDQKPLKILLLTWEYPPHIVGGLARHTEGLAVHLQKCGIEVHVITAKPAHFNDRLDENQAVKVYRVEPLNTYDHHFLNWIGGLNLAITQRAMKLAKEHEFHLIHAHDWLVGDAAKIISEYLHIPLLATIHGTENGRNGGIYTELQHFIHNKEKDLTHKSEKVIVCSEFMKQEVMNLFSIPEEKIAVIPNGITVDGEVHSREADLHPILLHEKRSIIFSIGRLVNEKGMDLLIEAAAKMDRTDICFVIGGTGPEYQEYEQLIRKYNLERDVYLTGFISDQQRNQFLQKSIMAVFPSRYEPFGIVALEAMKFKLPLIVSETGGLKGFIKHLETGLFMEPENEGSLRNQISFLLNNPQKGLEMANKAHQLIRNFYSWQRVAEMTKRIYDEQLLIYTIDDREQHVENIKN
jgi:glycosyltransferase involved in cell wall biosynthesis